jgi:hypothetical protein
MIPSHQKGSRGLGSRYPRRSGAARDAADHSAIGYARLGTRNDAGDTPRPDETGGDGDEMPAAGSTHSDAGDMPIAGSTHSDAGDMPTAGSTYSDAGDIPIAGSTYDDAGHMPIAGSARVGAGDGAQVGAGRVTEAGAAENASGHGLDAGSGRRQDTQSHDLLDTVADATVDMRPLGSPGPDVGGVGVAGPAGDTTEVPAGGVPPSIGPWFDAPDQSQELSVDHSAWPPQEFWSARTPGADGPGSSQEAVDLDDPRPPRRSQDGMS